MKQYTKQQGFTPIVVILVIAVIAALGFGSWYVWQNSKSQPVKQNQTQTNTQTDTNQYTDDPSEGGKYLVIKEWGVRFPVPEELRGDILYFMNDRAQRDFGGPVLADFVSKKFSEGNLKCAVEEGSLPRSLVSIERMDLAITPVTSTTSPMPFKILEAYAYRFSVTPCQEAVDREGSATDKRLLADLKYAIESSLEEVSSQ